jgi:hypothetical protein
VSLWDRVADAVYPRSERWVDDPILWARERLNIELWSKQRDVLQSVRDQPQTAVHACHNSGKSFSAAIACCWWLDVHPVGSAFVVTTAPTGDQVKAILWREIGDLHARGDLPGRTNLTEWYIGDRLVGLGRKPQEYKPDAFQGIHDEFVLVVIDEACGVPTTLWDAGDTLTSNDSSRTLAIGNPDDPHSKFGKVCKAGSGWSVVHIDGFATPNFTGEEVPSIVRRSLISPGWVEKKKLDWGVGSPLYIAKVRGRFPQDAADGVIPASKIAQCQRLESLLNNADPVCGGLDVGESHDRTVLYERRGQTAGRYEVINHGGDAMTAVGQVITKINDWGLQRVVVDVVGSGWGVYSRLRELSHAHNPTDPDKSHSAQVVRFHAGEASTQPKIYLNKRAELWWKVGRGMTRDLAWDLSAVPDDAVAELIEPKYHLDGSKQRIQVEPKEDIIKRLGRSPDLADALLMSFWQPHEPAVIESSLSRQTQLPPLVPGLT